MRKMEKLLVVLLAVALVLAVVLMWQRRTAAAARPSSGSAPEGNRAVNSLQEGIKPDAAPDYTGGGADRKRLMEKLREEERRQQPEKGRN